MGPILRLICFCNIFYNDPSLFSKFKDKKIGPLIEHVFNPDPNKQAVEIYLEIYKTWEKQLPIIDF